MTLPVVEHRAHGENGGCGFGEGNGVCRALAQRRRAERLRFRLVGERFGSACGRPQPAGCHRWGSSSSILLFNRVGMRVRMSFR